MDQTNRNSKGRRVKAFDFFCGAGGLTRGLMDAGIEVLAGIDNDERLQKTYENNEPSVFRCENIEDTDIHKLRKEFGVRDDDLVLYAACTPCQPFSTLNRMKGDDERRHLLLSFAELVEAAPPDFILVENVPGLNTAYGRDVYEQFVQVLDRHGFTHRFGDFLDAKDYGVPQVRRRFIMLASRLGPVKEPERVSKPKTVKDYIEEYPEISDQDDEHEDYPNHVSRTLQPHHRIIVKAVPEDGGSRSDVEDTSILLPCHQKNPNAHKDVFGRMEWGGQAPTLTRRCTDVYCGRFVHPDQDRGISLREAAALQTFRDDYVFHGTFHHIGAQIGNAVPVLLAERLGEAILSSIPQ